MLFPVDDINIMNNFPFESAREGQVDTIRYILDSFDKGKKFVIIEAPCGAGKSAIALAVAKFFPSSYYLTIQKILQDQLISEFGEGGKFGNFLIDLKGRSNYECPYYKLKAPELREKKVISLQQFQAYQGYHDCSNGHCRKAGSYKYDECITGNICPYYNQKGKAVASASCLMNFAGFLSQTNYTDSFGHRKLMIIDEGHNIETQLLNFISLTLDNANFPDLKLPILETPEAYVTWLEENQVCLIIGTQKQKALFAQDPKRYDELDALETKIDFFISTMTADGHDRWVHEIIPAGDRSSMKIVFKPVYIRKQAFEYLFNYADHILIMSATILNVNVMTRALGIDKKDVAAKRIGSRFPKENRPIIYRPAAKITGGPKQQHIWGPSLVDAVDKICSDHKGEKGIIHTHNFKIAEMLVQDCDPDISKRMLFQNAKSGSGQRRFRDKAELLEFHNNSDDTVIVAPAMHEGLDLRNELSRFQIICKIPFPNFYDDKQLAARKEEDEEFYSWLTALKLVQSVGRSVRSETDWATTYIIDASFDWWMRDNKVMLPEWFKEAVIYE